MQTALSRSLHVKGRRETEGEIDRHVRAGGGFTHIGVKGRRRRGRQRTGRLDGITDSMEISLSKLCPHPPPFAGVTGELL